MTNRAGTSADPIAGLIARQRMCAHPRETLSLGSGDYYVFCGQCGRQWMLKGADGRPEYATLPDGTKVGAAPEDSGGAA